MRTAPFRLILTVLAVIVFALPALAGRKGNVARGQTIYVPVYSYIYQGPKSRPYKLSTLLSIRNVALNDSITIISAKYYGSNGQLIKEHLPKPIVVPPMGTTEVFLPERNIEGGSGSNFIVQWESATQVSPPVVQAVMIGTASTQGISFVCEGVIIEEK